MEIRIRVLGYCGEGKTALLLALEKFIRSEYKILSSGGMNGLDKDDGKPFEIWHAKIQRQEKDMVQSTPEWMNEMEEKVIFTNTPRPGDVPGSRDRYKPTNPKDLLGANKIPMSTIPANVLSEVALAMLEGAIKYGRHNWRHAGVMSSIYYDAAMRHLMAWWEGEDNDPEGAQLHHITKAIAGLIILRDAIIRQELNDNRPKKSPVFYSVLNARAEEIITQLAADRCSK